MAKPSKKGLDLGKDAKALSSHVACDDFPPLTAALLRARLKKDWDAVREKAGES